MRRCKTTCSAAGRSRTTADGDCAKRVASRRTGRGWTGCIAGALSVGEYRRLLEAAGFDDVDIRFTHEVADGLHGAIVSGVKAADTPSILAALPAGGASGCC